MKKKSLELHTSDKKLFELDFDRSPQSNLFTIKKEWLVNFKTWGSRPEKVTIKIKFIWGCFVKNALFDSPFLVDLGFSIRIFCVFSIRDLEWLLDDVGFIVVPNININAKNLPFIGFWNPSYVRKSVPIFACIRLAYVGYGLCTQAKYFLGLLFSKNRFICS